MRFADSFRFRLAGWLGAALVRQWMGSLRIQTWAHEPRIDPLAPGCLDRCIYATWHETLLLPVYQYRRCRPITVISRSRDGEYLARIGGCLGWQVMRGSSSQGGTAVMREILALQRRSEPTFVAVTVDGPRGPRRVAKNGVVYLASRTGMPLVPAGVAFDRAWRTRSWDRFALPKPFSQGYIVLGKPIRVAPDADRLTIEGARQDLEQSLGEVTSQAESWAALGRFPPDSACQPIAA